MPGAGQGAGAGQAATPHVFLFTSVAQESPYFPVSLGKSEAVPPPTHQGEAELN